LSKNFHFLRYLLVPTGIVDPEHETLRPPQPPANLPTCDSRAAGANSLHLIKNPVTFTLISSWRSKPQRRVATGAAKT
jgi:hypothetical protein